ncbi:MAG: hypothetical protein HYX75_11325 [Acidobacteria bacterium]|nr:hypothetical protein [Acidobacteriota bacterium]
MRRTTVMLPDDLKTRAVLRARKLGISLGELIRSSLKDSAGKGARGEATDTMYDDAAIYRGPAPRDLSDRHDAYLYGDEG